ncbi:MAG: inositol monophosphatase [Desulfuromonas sp.]|nr:MAG: inositol monophosphatase [Desulfuromonas sp.]
MFDKQLLTEVCALVQEVGAYQLRCFRTLPSHHGDEKAAREFVSEVDIRSEERLICGLQRLLPEAGFYAEESGEQGEEKLRWIIDPLDGTTNFLSGLEQFSISVALQLNGRSELGVVYRPASAECFSALRRAGLTHRGQPCQQLSDRPLQQALIGTGFPYRSVDLADFFFPCARDILYRCRGIRRFGSAALDLSYVAAGFLQGFWESDLQPYDVAAAMLFLDESGCVLTNQRGERYSPWRDRILVCAPAVVHRELLPLVAAHYPQNI